MRKIIYASSITIITASLILYFNIAGGKEGGLSAPGSGADENISSASKNENYSEYHFSPRSGGWQLQVMPNMGNRLVRDLYFTDSLTGYAVASPESVLDSSHILKTTNGGNNWTIKATYVGNLPRITFINANTGFAGGNFLLKTTNAGENWMVWNWGPDRIIYDMQVFSEDTIWYADRFQIGGGAYRTTNGGINWEKRDNGIPANSYPDKIYFYNNRIGFAYKYGNPSSYKTTDGGLNWFQYNTVYSKITFKDSLHGYYTNNAFYRTTNGGSTWSKDSLPKVLGNTYTIPWVNNYTFADSNIIYSVGGYVNFLGNGSSKAIIYKTTNGGLNWGYQIPDTSYNFFTLTKAFSINKNNVWLYSTWKGVYSSTGGDSTIYVGINNNSNMISNNFELSQNYPNPFNQLTVINYQLPIRTDVKISIYNVSGKEVSVIVDKNQNEGVYEISYDAGNLCSGVYFYQLIADGKVLRTKKMILLK